VIARVLKGATPLIHVDAYRLLAHENAKFEFDDLDLDTGRASAITVIEWGGEVGERFGEDFLELVIKFGEGEDEREITSIAHGNRWAEFKI
jgi:tRNA threonylcarbamoyladenosine biosynthesis protein TsaE